MTTIKIDGVYKEVTELTILDRAAIARSSFNSQAKLIGQLADTIVDWQNECYALQHELDRERADVRRLRIRIIDAILPQDES